MKWSTVKSSLRGSYVVKLVQVFIMTRCVLLGFFLILTAILVAVEGKTMYKLHMNNIQILEINPEYLDVKQSWIRLGKQDRDTAILDAAFNILEPLHNNTLISFHGFEKFSSSSAGVYEDSLIRFDDILLADVMADGNYKSLQANSNLPETMPWPKGNYTIKQYILDESRLPDVIPGEHWRLNVQVYYKDVVIFHVASFFRLERLMPTSWMG